MLCSKCEVYVWLFLLKLRESFSKAYRFLQVAEECCSLLYGLSQKQSCLVVGAVGTHDDDLLDEMSSKRTNLWFRCFDGPLDVSQRFGQSKVV